MNASFFTRAAVVVFFLSGLHAPAAAAEVLRLATTTSAENSGLLPYLLPDFESQCGCRVEVVAVGSGRALSLGRRGDADVLLVHSPQAEKKFVESGYGIERLRIMRNDFVLLGPDNDPAHVAAQKNIARALSAIARGGHIFVSRGDESGTHQKEQQLWRLVEDEINFSPRWFVSAGVGMGQAIVVADELRGYVLSDRGTYLHFRDRVDLTIMVENSPPLHNFYSIVIINPRRYAHINLPLARRFSRWLRSSAVQRRIAEYRVSGERLFFPAAHGDD